MSWASLTNRMNKRICKTFPANAIHTPLVGEATTFTCVHDYEWIEIETSNGLAQSSQMHTAFITISDLNTFPKQDDSITIDDVLYTIVDVRVDGSGGVKLILHLGE